MAGSIQNLIAISKSRQFPKDYYICHEGQPGSEMYVILKGKVSVSINNSMGVPIQVVTLESGEFFGEMALFDKLPRSASCMAMEDTVCAAVGADKLQQFITACPDIAEKLMMSLSSRLRQMNNRLYKSSRQVIANENILPFCLPEAYAPCHALEAPKSNPRYVDVYPITCPVCGKIIHADFVKFNALLREKVLPNRRPVYRELDPLWHYIWDCASCGYHNYYLKFVGMSGGTPERVRQHVDAQNKVLRETELSMGVLSDFDQMALKYFRAIHLNESLDKNDSRLLGSLWLFVRWLFEEAGDAKMTSFCRKKLLSCVEDVYRNQFDSLGSVAEQDNYSFIYAQALREENRREEAKKVYQKIIDFTTDAKSKLEAYQQINLL